MSLKLERGSKHAYYQRVCVDTPTWDDVFSNLEKSIEENSLIKFNNSFSIITHNGDKHIESVRKFTEIIKNIARGESVSAHVYISLSKYSEGFGKHEDVSDVFFWQVIGSTKWKVFEDKVYEYELTVGDVIYVPKFVPHEVTSLGPRVGISVGIDPS